MNRYCDCDTPLGAMLLVAKDDALCGAYFVGQKYFPQDRAGWVLAADDALLRRARAELDEYFAGQRRAFSLPIAAQGTAFQRRVWQALLDVRHGETVSYGELARRLGMPGSARAVGAAVGRNPVSIFIPCHRALGATGALTGYAGGLPRKQALLALEGRSGNQAVPISACQATGRT